MVAEEIHRRSPYLLQSKIARLINCYHVLLPVAVLAVSGWVHHLAGLTFPVPWDDEAIFIYPAAAVAEANQLQTDSLNAERPVFYHSPGYPVALGLVFKFARPGLISARWFSWCLLALAYLAGLGMIRRLDGRSHAAIVWSLFFLGGHTAIAGNIARPEALVLGLSLTGCWMMQEGRPWTAAALLVLGCLVHPAAWFLSAAAAAGYLREEGWRCPASQKRDWPWIALAAFCFMALAIYVGMRWRWVWNDLQVSMNFLHQTWGQRFSVLKSPWNGIPAALVLALPVVTFRLRRPLFSLALLVAALWFLPIYRPEMWYSVYTAFAYAFAAVVLIELAARHLPPAARWFGRPAVIGAILLSAFALGHVPDPRHYPSYFWWRHMTIRPQPDYIQAADIEAVAAALHAHAAAPGTGRVQFYPNGDGALFLGRLPEPWIPYYPSFTDEPPTAIVFHQTRLAYPSYPPVIAAAMEARGVDSESPLHARDETEKWFVWLAEPELTADRAPAFPAVQSAGE